MRSVAIAICFAFALPTAQAGPQGVRVVVEPHRSVGTQPTLGPDTAPVTIEYFLDLGGRPIDLHKRLVELSERHPTRLRVVYRLTGRHARASSMALNFAREAFERGIFWRFIDTLYADGSSRGSRDYPAIAEELGLNYDEVLAAASELRHEDALNVNRRRWTRLQMNNLPGLAINGEPVAGEPTLEALEILYDQAYERATSDLLAGKSLAEIRTPPRLEPILGPTTSGPLDGEPFDVMPVTPSPVRMTELINTETPNGPKSAPVSIGLICNLDSLMCKRMFSNMMEIRGAFPDEVQVHFRNYTRPEDPSRETALLMYEAVLCAGDQGAFWNFMEHVYNHQARINFDVGVAIDLANSPALELDSERFERCMETGKFQKRVGRELALVERAGVQHTPAMVIGGLLYNGRFHADEIRSLVYKHLQPGVLGRLPIP